MQVAGWMTTQLLVLDEEAVAAVPGLSSRCLQLLVHTPDKLSSPSFLNTPFVKLMTFSLPPSNAAQSQYVNAKETIFSGLCAGPHHGYFSLPPDCAVNPLLPVHR